jgi:hypothetical protein
MDRIPDIVILWASGRNDAVRECKKLEFEVLQF